MNCVSAVRAISQCFCCAPQELFPFLNRLSATEMASSSAVVLLPESVRCRQQDSATLLPLQTQNTPFVCRPG